MIPPPKQIYRKAALERLSSPEQLDQLIQVVRPTSWILLIALLVLLAAFVLWGFLGTVSTQVEGQGMLLGGSVYDLVPLAAGQLTHVHVAEGDEVTPGTLVAEMAQPELALRINDARTRLAEQRAAYAELQAFGTQDSQLQTGFVAQQRRTLNQLIAATKERLAYLENQIEAEQKLLAQGLITRQQLQATQQQRDAARAEIEEAEAQRTQVSSQELSAEFNLQQQLTLSQQRIGEASRLLDQLSSDYETRTRVVSRYQGRILEIMADAGDLVEPGQPLMKLGLSDAATQPMQVVLYVPTQDGKKITEGMAIQVAPATVKPEEYGYLIGRVERVADFPSTTRSMLHVLKNDQLARQLAQAGAPFEVIAVLTPDVNTPSGYQWTSGQGPPVALHSSTPATARITVRTQRPIDLVVPKLRTLFSL